jgi:ferredoxin
MGKGASKVDRSKWPGARLATKEEALERERLAYENGLVPHIGKFRSDAVLYDVLDYEDEFMDICHCCSCCCVCAVGKYAPKEFTHMIKKIEGVTLTIDDEKCQNGDLTCKGECFKVCIYNGLKYKKGKAVLNEENCLLCGRCEGVCPKGAISISIDDYSCIDEIIERFDSRVDISG